MSLQCCPRSELCYTRGDILNPDLRRGETGISFAIFGIYAEDTEADFSSVIPPRHHAPLAAAGGILAVTLVCSGLFAAAILRLEPMQVLTAKEE